jgi:hypothetical protein
MIGNLFANKVLWALTALLSLVAALVGVFSSDIYIKVVSPDIMPGVFGQDIMTIAASIIILILTVRIRPESWKKQVVIFGIIGYLFYAYGIYVIERVYTPMYLVYLAIFGLSFWSLAYGVAKTRQEVLPTLKLSRLIRNISVGFSLLVAVIFEALWVLQLLPLMQAGEKIEFMYSIYILDICFIMPAFIIAAIMALRKQKLGLIFIPALFVLGFILIFSLVVSEMVRPLFQLDMNMSGMWPSLVLSIIFLVLAVFYLRGLKINRAST